MIGSLGRLFATAAVCSSLVACAQVAPPTAPESGAGGTAQSRDQQAPSARREPPQFAPSVTEPKDARGIAECDLLTPAQLDQLGLASETARPRTVGAARVCSWTYEGGRKSAALQIATERTIPGLDGIYVQRVGYARFEPVTVAGHPGFHADQAESDGCTLYIAIADYQMMTVVADLRAEPLPDPCAPSRRMAEMILSNLPPLAP